MKSIRNEKGQGTVEYILIAALVVILAIGAFKIFGPAIKSSATNTANTIQGQGNAAGQGANTDVMNGR